MARFKKFVPLAVLLASVELALTACGTGSSRVLQAISVTPSTADAQSFPNGQVQFTVMGTYSQPPSPSPVAQAQWTVSDPNVASVSLNGLAQCNAGAVGVVTVRASTPAPCSGTACTAALLVGTAQLNCP